MTEEDERSKKRIVSLGQLAPSFLDVEQENRLQQIRYCQVQKHHCSYRVLRIVQGLMKTVSFRRVFIYRLRGRLL